MVAATSLMLLGSAPYAPRAAQIPHPLAAPGSTARPGADGHGPLILQGPPVPAAPTSTATTLLASTTSTYGIPATVLDAYKRAEASTASSNPGCHLSWPLLAAIGQVESGQAHGGDVDSSGRVLHAILGPALNGTNGNGAMPNVFGAEYDQLGQWMRAAGPMQFLPSTWTTWGADGNGDGVKDPENIYDAALSASHYLCNGGGDLATPNGLQSAILSYNHSQQYLSTVLAWMRAYGQGGVPVPDQPGQGGAAPQPEPVSSSSGGSSSSSSRSSGSSGSQSASRSQSSTSTQSSGTSGSSSSSSGSSSTSGSGSTSSGSSSSGSTSSGSTSTSTAPSSQPSSPLPAPINNVVSGVTRTLGSL